MAPSGAGSKFPRRWSFLGVASLMWLGPIDGAAQELATWV
jgi:hypothetical protein